MKNIKKILPAIALAGVIGLLGASSASAYSYEQLKGYQNGVQLTGQNPDNVEICYTVNGILTTFQTTYTIPITVDSSSSINLSAVTGDTYTSSDRTHGSFTIAFNESGSQNNVTKCATLNFGSALSKDAAFDTHTVKMGTVTSTNPNAPIDTAYKELTFGYQLSTDSQGAPIASSNGTYQAEYWTKSTPSYERTIDRVNTYIMVTKTVKGNAAIPKPSNSDGKGDGFIFKARVVKAQGVGDTAYNIYDGNSTIATCQFASSMTDDTKDCEFRLSHGQTAYIGCNSANCANGGQLPLNAIQYSITETNPHEHTVYIGEEAKSTTGEQSLTSKAPSYAFRNEKTNTIAGRFFNIIPFIILAILATVGVVTLRKASKKNEA